MDWHTGHNPILLIKHEYPKVSTFMTKGLLTVYNFYMLIIYYSSYN